MSGVLLSLENGKSLLPEDSTFLISMIPPNAWKAGRSLDGLIV